MVLVVAACGVAAPDTGSGGEGSDDGTTTTTEASSASPNDDADAPDQGLSDRAGGGSEGRDGSGVGDLPALILRLAGDIEDAGIGCGDPMPYSGQASDTAGSAQCVLTGDTLAAIDIFDSQQQYDAYQEDGEQSCSVIGEGVSIPYITDGSTWVVVVGPDEVVAAGEIDDELSELIAETVSALGGDLGAITC